MGLSSFAPISSGGVVASDPYTWRSSGIVGKTLDWGEVGWQTVASNPSAMAQLRLAVAETQRLRPVAIYGDYYPLTPIAYDNTLWAAYQFHCSAGVSGCPSSDAGFVIIFRRPQVAAGPFNLFLYQIELQGSYRVSWYNESYAETRTITNYSGFALAQQTIWLANSSSLLVEYSIDS